MNREPWTKEADAVVKAMLMEGASITDVCAAFPTRTRKAIKMRIEHVRKGCPSRSLRVERGYIPTATEMRRMEEMRPINSAAQLWGHITRTGQLRPIVKVELEKVA